LNFYELDRETQKENTDLLGKLPFYDTQLKKEIGGDDGDVDVVEFNILTSNYGWPQGLAEKLKEIERKYHEVFLFVWHQHSSD
jgi:hypothetical protein